MLPQHLKINKRTVQQGENEPTGVVFFVHILVVQFAGGWPVYAKNRKLSKRYALNSYVHCNMRLILFAACEMHSATE